jgi:uncharacterized protein (DUF362 family)
MAISGIAAINFFSLQKLYANSGENETALQKDGDLIAVMGDQPILMLERAIQELGGIDKFVKPGDKVVIKPNIGWAKKPEMSANTNPLVVGALTKLCLDHGAAEVIVFDHTCNEWKSCYELSGIKKEVEANGGKMIPGNNESYYTNIDLPHGKILKSTRIHQALLDCDVWFNIPVLKHHGGAKMSISMKNYMGIIWDRRYFHKQGLQQCIADVNSWEKKPALHIVDAYRSLTQNGPQGKSEADVVQTNAMFVSADPVAVDTAAIKFFAQLKPVKLEDVGHVALGEEHHLGTSDLSQKNIKRIKL